MRDKNQTPEKFNIQLEKAVHSKLRDDRLLRTAVANSPKCLCNTDSIKVVYPRDFAGLRALSIALWSFPEELLWRVRLDLGQMSFSHLNSKQKLELSILLESKEICYFYLFETERYTARELFGNILGNQLKDALRQLRIEELTPRNPRRVQRHRGYRDKGSLRPSHRWLESSDYSFTEYQLQLEKKRYLQSKYSQIVKQLLTEKLQALNRSEELNKENDLLRDGKD